MRPLRTAALALLLATPLSAQGPFGGPPPLSFPTNDAVIRRLWTLGQDSSRAAEFLQVLSDSVGPRLHGSPHIKAGHDWMVKTYGTLGISAKNEQFGTWRGWKRGVSHIDLVAPRVRSLEGMALAWSPGTKGEVTGSVALFPDVADSAAFQAWLPNAKGKFVLISQPLASCRPDGDWQANATAASYARYRAERDTAARRWQERTRRTGLNARGIALAIENAGALGVVASRWSSGWGVNKIFEASTEKVPTVDVSCEDYGLVWRLAERNQGPQLRVRVEAQELGTVPVFNTIATIPGEKADEYVMMSAHFDSWDGGSGTTDNGTGTVTMLEAARLLTLAYPKPKRTIVIGHWSGEEQGLIGSHAFVEDHPEVVKGLHALFNQDNGTGRIVNLSASGFVDAGAHLARYFSRLPSTFASQVTLNFPGSPAGGGSDHASFACAGAPGFSLGALGWEYGTYTWHTQRDTYDKMVLDDLKANATLTAMLVYLAAEDPEFMPRARREMPMDARTREAQAWPACAKAIRKWEDRRR